MVLILLITGLSMGFDASAVDSLRTEADTVAVNVFVKPRKTILPVRNDTASVRQQRPEPHAVATPVARPDSVPSKDSDILAQPDSSDLASSAEPSPFPMGAVAAGVLALAVIGFFALRKRKTLESSPIPSKKADDEPVVVKNEGIPVTAGGVSMTIGQAQHLGMRRQQQDAFGLSDPAASPFIAVLADGMGGMKNGAVASKTAIREFLASTTSGLSATQAAHHANSVVYQSGVDSGEAEGTGTTLAAVLISNGEMHWISVGDSQIYLLRNGELSKVNTEHSYLLELYQDVIRQQTDLSEARAHSQRDALTSFIGLQKLTQIDHSIHGFPLKSDDIIMVCSDGLYRALNDTELRSILSASHPNPADELVKRAMAKNHPYQDNTTVITLQIDRIR